MSIFYIAFGIAALFFVLDSFLSSDDADNDGERGMSDDDDGSDDNGSTDDRDVPDDNGSDVDGDEPDDDTDDTLPETEFDPEFGAWPQGVFFARSDPDAETTNFLLSISDDPESSIILEGGILQMDSPQFDPDDYMIQIFEYIASDNGSFVESLTLREDGALILQHPDANAPLIIEGADFNQLFGDIELLDLRTAQDSFILRPPAGTIVLGGDGPLNLWLRGDMTVVLGSGNAVVISLGEDEPNEIVAGEGRLVYTATPGDTISAAEGQLLNGALELRLAEGDAAAGPTIIEGFDVSRSQILLFEPFDQFGPDTRAPISLVDSDAGLQVFSGERLVAVLPGITQADNPQITHEAERWGGTNDPLSFL